MMYVDLKPALESLKLSTAPILDYLVLNDNLSETDLKWLRDYTGSLLERASRSNTDLVCKSHGRNLCPVAARYRGFNLETEKVQVGKTDAIDYLDDHVLVPGDQAWVISVARELADWWIGPGGGYNKLVDAVEKREPCDVVGGSVGFDLD
jgi:hypothetical protein